MLETAVSVHTGKGRLLFAQSSGGAMLASAGTPPDFTGVMNVNLVSIDDLLAQKILKPPTLVKVDVEGAEIDAFKGMRQTITTYKAIIIYEVDDANKNSFEQKSNALIFLDLATTLQQLNTANVAMNKIGVFEASGTGTGDTNDISLTSTKAKLMSFVNNRS